MNNHVSLAMRYKAAQAAWTKPESLEQVYEVLKRLESSLRNNPLFARFPQVYFDYGSVAIWSHEERHDQQEEYTRRTEALSRQLPPPSGMTQLERDMDPAPEWYKDIIREIALDVFAPPLERPVLAVGSAARIEVRGRLSDQFLETTTLVLSPHEFDDNTDYRFMAYSRITSYPFKPYPGDLLNVHRDDTWEDGTYYPQTKNNNILGFLGHIYKDRKLAGTDMPLPVLNEQAFAIKKEIRDIAKNYRLRRSVDRFLDSYCVPGISM